MKPLFKLAFGAGLAVVPLIGSAIPGYVTDERGVVVRTDNPSSGINECWHTSDWTPEMAIVGCDGKVAEVIPEPEPEPVYEVPCEDHTTMTDDSEALFAFDKARLSSMGMAKLDDLISRISTFRVERVVITGHTDRLGSDAYNERLSLRRAEAVRDYLLDRQAVEPYQVEVYGKGESMPIVDCDGIRSRRRLIACLAPNRRVVVDVSGMGTGGCN